MRYRHLAIAHKGSQKKEGRARDGKCFLLRKQRGQAEGIHRYQRGREGRGRARIAVETQRIDDLVFYVCACLQL